MQADAGSPTPERASTKRTALSVAVVIAGMVLFALFQSFHSSAVPDDAGYQALPSHTTSSFHAAAPDGESGSSSSPSASAPIRYGSLTFHGYVCTLDCSGHMAGYNFGKAAGISNPHFCPNAPPYFHSLTEGCWAETGRQGGS